MPQKRKLFVAIAGNIGVGKTTLTKKLSERLEWKAYYEKVVDNPYLSDFYADMNRWSFHLQVFFLSNRFKNQREINDWPDSCIQDRSIYEDVEIFAHTLHKQGSMSDKDYENYHELFSTMVEYLRKPDIILYLRSSVDRLIKQIAKRGREYEKTIDPKYLVQLNEAYDEWIERAKDDGFHVVTIETKNHDFENNEEDFQLIYQPIKELEQQTWLKGV
ncbi:MAG: deoxynucleoside kinase [Calditrichaeota bacterium]|nr:MAG: deoxynucleoside kinase [Calditrichota bacterium]MBL1205773.1 deoxynucleoside kinase [Calditrichota bacterium]NOG45601.1 deoxynucleoside kinase [Calditrichota bacterium]